VATDVPIVARPEDRANYEKGRRLLAAGEAKRALEPLTAAAHAMPRDAAVAHDYGIALVRTGDTRPRPVPARTRVAHGAGESRAIGST
jgi:Flp pilus assembly protein TadD